MNILNQPQSQPQQVSKLVDPRMNLNNNNVRPSLGNQNVIIPSQVRRPESGVNKNNIRMVTPDKLKNDNRPIGNPALYRPSQNAIPQSRGSERPKTPDMVPKHQIIILKK